HETPRRNVEGRPVEGEAFGPELLVRLVHAVHEEPAARPATSGAGTPRCQDQIRVLVELEVRRAVRRRLHAEQLRIPAAGRLLVAHELDYRLDAADAHGGQEPTPSARARQATTLRVPERGSTRSHCSSRSSSQASG